MGTPGGAAPAAVAEGSEVQLEPYLTTAGARPKVYQNGVNASIGLTANIARPLSIARLEVDSILFNVYSTAANSIFFGYGSSVTPTNGIEIRPGLPLLLGPENQREQWELQRVLEFMAAVMAFQAGTEPLAPYRAPRVCFDASQLWVVAAANTQLQLIFFFPPEQQ